MDWIKTGWGADFSETPKDKRDTFFVDLRSEKSTKLDIISVAKDAINSIIKKYPPPYNLFVSGGIDSQSMIWLWKHSQVPFTVNTVEYINPDDQSVFNSHDHVQLKKFAYIHDIPVNYKKFDLTAFLENELLDYATTYQCASPQICTHMKMSEIYHTGTVVFSGNFKLHHNYDYTIWGLKRYADLSGRNVIPFFLLHDKELSCYIDDYAQKTYDVHASNAVDYQYLQRASTMQASGIPVIPQSEKFTGFEKVKDFYDIKAANLSLIRPMERIEFSRFPSKRAFDIMFRYRLHKLLKYNNVVTYLR
jgi:hypothetical protein